MAMHAETTLQKGQGVKALEIELTGRKLGASLKLPPRLHKWNQVTFPPTEENITLP
jgi:hypothetical protein